MESLLFVSTFTGASVSSSLQKPSLSSSSNSSTRPRVLRKAGVVRATPTAQFNYNIYQDGSERSKRSASAGERTVVVPKPLGLILEESQDGMCFIASMDPNGNAARTGKIQVGDIIVACSATFGDEIWSTRGVGLAMLMKSISVRQGNLVTLVLESPSQVAEKKQSAANQALGRRSEARAKFGERKVLDPVTWAPVEGRSASSPYSEDMNFTPEPTATVEGYVEPEAPAPYQPMVSEADLKRQIEEEEAGPGKEADNTVLYGSIAVVVGLIITIYFLSR